MNPLVTFGLTRAHVKQTLPPVERDHGVSIYVLWALVLAATVGLGGCTSTASKWQSDLPAANLSHWEARGKLGLTHQNQAKTVNFQWKNRGQAFDIRLFGLFGMGSAHLNGDAHSVTLTTKDGSYHSDNVNTLMNETLNMSLPVEELVFWIKGIPAPKAAVTQQTHHPDGAVALIVQRGWTLKYPRYFQDRTPILPQKIIAERDGLKLTIAIKSWQLD